jgi:WD40 repeat protein
MVLLLALLLATPPTDRPIDIVRDSPVVVAPAFSGCTTSGSGDGHTVLTGGYDGTFQFWSLDPNGKVAFKDALKVKDFDNQGGWAGIAYDVSSDGKEFAVSQWDGRFEVWQRDPLKRMYRISLSRPAYGLFEFHRTKPWLLVGDGDSPAARERNSAAVHRPSASSTSRNRSLPK